MNADAPDSKSSFRLVGTEASTPLEHALAAGETTIGRVADNDLVIDVAEVSRHHARVTVTGARVAIADLGSTNGTFVNGERVTAADLMAGDEIRLGAGVRLRLASEVDHPQTVIAAAADGTLLAVPQRVDRNATQLVQLSPAPETPAPK